MQQQTPMDSKGASDKMDFYAILHRVQQMPLLWSNEDWKTQCREVLEQESGICADCKRKVGT